jgi:hypothetical protein
VLHILSHTCRRREAARDESLLSAQATYSKTIADLHPHGLRQRECLFAFPACEVRSSQPEMVRGAMHVQACPGLLMQAGLPALACTHAPGQGRIICTSEPTAHKTGALACSAMGQAAKAMPTSSRRFWPGRLNRLRQDIGGGRAPAAPRLPSGRIDDAGMGQDLRHFQTTSHLHRASPDAHDRARSRELPGLPRTIRRYLRRSDLHR